MGTSPDHPELQYVQARYFSKGRPDGPPLWIVIHDMEATETATRAESTAAYFATMPDGRTVSAHYCVDSDSVVQCVLLADVAWTVGNRPGNYRGINWEMSGFARQTREQWLDDFGRAMFAQMVPIIRSDAAKFGIPLRRCSVADLTARRPGITSHNDLRLAFGGTTHTDPGPAFPWDYLLALLSPTEPTGEDMQCLIRYKDDPEGRVWLADRMTRRLVTVDQLVDAEQLGNAAFVAQVVAGQTAATGPIADISGYVGGLLGNNGKVYQTAGFTVPRGDAWGVEYPPATSPGSGATPAQVEEIVDRQLDQAFSAGADS